MGIQHLLNSTKKAPSTVRSRYEIGPAELPLYCPTKKNALWNAHPRVFLAIEETGYAKCPYCGTDYYLKKSGK
ncbi:MAG: zinc-finger domain-containing protein [Pseudomonadota bacterium]